MKAQWGKVDLFFMGVGGPIPKIKLMGKSKEVMSKLDEYYFTKMRFRSSAFCPRCENIGIVRVLIDGLGMLAKCDCEWGERQTWDLPFAKDVSPRQQPLPVQEFLPPYKPKSQEQVQYFIKEKTSWWKEKIYMSVDFFNDLKNERKRDRDIDTGIPEQTRPVCLEGQDDGNVRSSEEAVPKTE